MIVYDEADRITQLLDADLFPSTHEHMRTGSGHDFAVGLLIVRHGDADRRQTQRRALPTGATAGADKQIGLSHALMEIADETVQAPVRSRLGQRLHLRPRRVVGASDEVHLQLSEISQRQHRMMSLPRRVETAEIHQHTPGLRFDLDGIAVEFFAQHGVARAEQGATAWRQQRRVVFTQAREVLIEQQIDAVTPRGQIIHGGDSMRPAPGSGLPVMIEAVMVDDDPVERCLPIQQQAQCINIELPRQHRFDGLQRVFVAIALGQCKGLEAFGIQGFESMPRQTPTGKRNMTALPAQHPRQSHAAGNVAAADGWRGVGADQHSHCSSPPALSAAYRYSARCQSSGVSMSWTK